MKRILFTILLNMLGIGIATRYLPGLSYQGGILTLGLISVILAAANIFVKPIIKLLTLPIELITLGLFGLLINAGMLFLTAYFIPQFMIKGFYFTGIDNAWFTINATMVPAWGTAVIASLFISVITSLVTWFTDK